MDRPVELMDQCRKPLDRGDVTAARQRMETAAAEAHAERGKAALAAGDTGTAVTAFKAALRIPDDSGIRRSGLEQRYAAALLAADRPYAAAAALDRGVDALVAAGAPTAARRALLDGAALLQAYGHWELADRFAAQAEVAADAAHDAEAATELALLAAVRAVDRRDLAAARRHAERARARALAGRSATAYVAAAVAMAELAEAAEDRAAAYASLAAGWAALRDLVGLEPAGPVFARRLANLRDRWGAGEFDEIRAAYEAGR